MFPGNGHHRGYRQHSGFLRLRFCHPVTPEQDSFKKAKVKLAASAMALSLGLLATHSMVPSHSRPPWPLLKPWELISEWLSSGDY